MFSIKHILVFVFLGIAGNMDVMGAKINEIKIQLNPIFDGYVEFTGSVGNLQSKSLQQCSFNCLINQKCLTLFYNIYTKQCVLHSKDFYQLPSDSGAGWNYFNTMDVSGRCPLPYLFYYRHLDFCYIPFTYWGPDFQDVKQHCAGMHNGKVAVIDSEQKQEYFDHVLANRIYQDVCIAGDVQANGSVVLDDGSQLQYSNWFPGEPSNPDHRCIRYNFDSQWFDMPCVNADPCQVLCEF